MVDLGIVILRELYSDVIHHDIYSVSLSLGLNMCKGIIVRDAVIENESTPRLGFFSPDF